MGFTAAISAPSSWGGWAHPAPRTRSPPGRFWVVTCEPVPAAVRTLTQRQVLLALLERQLLLRRARTSIPKALERMGGLQAQYAPSMYIGLWTRLEQFSRADLDHALVRRNVVQATLMRSTIHMVSAADYWL